jgi:phospholipid/cholesterol/gamma-HCH transport system substrate-binding protein
VAISKEVKVGLLALIAGTILYVGFNFLKGIDFFSPTKTYFAVYDNIDGLTVSNPVMLNGLAVGRVHSIKILQERNNSLLVTLEINDEIELGDSSQAILTSNGFLEGKMIVLKPKKRKNILNEKDTITAIKDKGFTDLLTSKATPVLNHLDSTIYSVNNVLNQIQAERKLQMILFNLEQSTNSLNRMLADGGKISNTIGNIERLSASLAETEKSLKPLIGKMSTLADSLSQVELAKTVENANRSITELKAILAGINQGQGTLGKLVKSDSLYTNMNKAVVDLDKLFIDMKARPKRYVQFSVFGKKDKDK